ncbi:MAG: universal stress protein [Deinococcota bacterium]
MTPFKALIPLDGSPFSAQVLPSVCRLLDPKQHALTLLRVAPVPVDLMPLPTPPRPITISGWTGFTESDGAAARELAQHPIYASQVWDSVRAELKDDLQDELDKLEAAGFNVSLSVRFGEPATEISQLVKAENFDLVVMATHGRSGLRRVLMGSVAETVLRSAGVPVLTMRPVAPTKTSNYADAHTVNS